MLKYKLDRSFPMIVRYVLDKRGWQMTNHEDSWQLYWRNGRFHPNEVFNAQHGQYFNHFLNSGLMTRKAGMTHYLKQFRRTHGKIYDFTPPSFILNMENLDNIDSRLTEQTKKQHWIVKPSNGSQGRGIQLVKDLRTVSLDSERTYTAQLYISDPWLICGYKFDLRIYALVTSFHPLTIHLYKEGLVRFATEKYDLELDDTDRMWQLNKFKHLTNTSINKKSTIFHTPKPKQPSDYFEKHPNLANPLDKDETDVQSSTFTRNITELIGLGSQSRRTLRQLASYMLRNNVDFSKVWHDIEKIVTLSLLPLCEHIPKTNAHCFEIFGFDIILDKQLQPWLIEINFSPSLGGDNRTDQTVKESLIEDVIDTLNISSTYSVENPADQVRIKNTLDLLARTPVAITQSPVAQENGVGNFKRIFPFNQETLYHSSKLADLVDINEQLSSIVEQVHKKYSSLHYHDIL